MMSISLHEIRSVSYEKGRSMRYPTRFVGRCHKLMRALLKCATLETLGEFVECCLVPVDDRYPKFLWSLLPKSAVQGESSPG
eukprot:1025290-Pleurochrysis_carterae.AAC.1